MTVTESLAPVPVTGMPRIGDPAPAFTAVTTQGEINFPADYSRQMGYLLFPSGGLHTGVHQ